MHLFDVVLFCHIAVAISAFFLSGIIHTSEYLVGKSATAPDALRMLKVQKLAPIFAVLILLLFGLGSWLVALSDSPDKFSFSDPFVYVAIVVLAIVLVDGPVIMGTQAKKLGAALAQSADGSITPAARELMKQPLPAIVSFGNTFVVLAVVFNMATKPNLVGCVASVVVGLLVGVVLGLRSTSSIPAASTA